MKASPYFNLVHLLKVKKQRSNIPDKIKCSNISIWRWLRNKISKLYVLDGTFMFSPLSEIVFYRSTRKKLYNIH